MPAAGWWRSDLGTHRVARLVMSGVFELSLMFIVVGARGFTRGGLPLSASKRITGRRGRVVGTLCLLFGTLGIALAFWGSPPAERQALSRFCYGIVTGI